MLTHSSGGLNLRRCLVPTDEIDVTSKQHSVVQYYIHVYNFPFWENIKANTITLLGHLLTNIFLLNHMLII